MSRLNASSLALATLASIGGLHPIDAQIPPYSTTYSTAGSSLACAGQSVFKEGMATCTKVGNSLWITSSLGQTFTVSFAAVTAPLVATIGTQVVNLGTISTTLSGPGSFAFPETVFPWWTPLQFQLDLKVSSPVGGETLPVATVWFKSVTPTFLIPDVDYQIARWDTPIPKYFLSFGLVSTSAMEAGNGSVDVFGVAGLVAPEPSTFVLVGSGLAGFVLRARRKRRSM
jgi:hypothetical protein